MRNVLAVILGGGKGTRLFPLTHHRSKPAVPLAGKYRLIDIPISNCLNSRINRIYLLTQFNSVSLHAHIRKTYRFDRFDGGFVEILAAQQTMEGEAWYQGTADAVRKNLRYLEQKEVEYVLILSGDQLYRMNFAEMLADHKRNKAEVSIAALPVGRQEARACGVMRLDDTGRVKGFLEKPQTDAEIDLVRTDPAWIDSQGLQSKGRDCLASMGIYLFNRDVLLDLLNGSDYHDFGKEVFPMALRTRDVFVHLFDGYWEDIGTIRSFYDANIQLASPDAPFRLDDQDAPIYTHARFLPPSRLDGVMVKHSLIAEGCSIGEGSVIENSVIGLRSQIGKNVTIRNSIIMGTDYFETPDELQANRDRSRPSAGVGAGSTLDGVILDKNCRVGSNVRLVVSDGKPFNHEKIVVQDGVIIVPKECVLQDGWK